MNSVVIKAENLGKIYRLGEIGSGMLSQDLQRWWNKLNGKNEDLGKINLARPTAEPKDWFWALREINFDIKRGEVLGIIGRNGAGKSTLLKILSKVTTATTGSVKVKGRIASLLEVGTGFHPELTGRENIFLNGAILGMTKKEIKSRFDEIVDFSGVEQFIDTPVKRYSSGMYVRLAFSVAAFLEPEILIVDEVLAVGDAEFQKKCLGKMKDVSEGEGRTILFVSHNMGAINKLCSRCMVLSKGEIIADGSVNESILRYLALDSLAGSKLEYRVNDKPPVDAYIKSISLSAETDRAEGVFDVHDELSLEIIIVVNKTISGSTPYYDLKKNGEVIYRSFAIDMQGKMLEKMEPGEFRFRTRLHQPLKKGEYTIDVRLLKVTADFYDEVNEQISFSIDELEMDLLYKSYSSLRPGLIGINLPWQVESTAIMAKN